MELMFRRAVFDHDVLALDEACFLQALTEGGHEVHSVSERGVPQEPNHRHFWLLRVCRERPHRSRAAEERDELAAVHSITSSARASSVGGTSRPSALAVLRLITSSNRVGCTTGSSAGLAPLRILSTRAAARSKFSRNPGP